MKTYETDEQFRTYCNDDGERFLLANFTAEIVRETRFTDGKNNQTFLTLKGRNEVEEFEHVEIEADKFAGLQWVMAAWGTTAVISPGGGCKEDFRTAIQLASQPERRTIYTHTGWTQIAGKPAFLHAGGAITAEGNNPAVNVQLPMELSRYNIESKAPAQVGIRATLDLRNIAPKETSWTLIAATLAPLCGPVDFAVHVTGRTGTFKSELLSLFQSHFGSDMDARHLPGSWSSTANALEAQAYRICNAPFTLDDFVPTGTSWQIRTYQKTADQIIRAQGNQSGRARLTDTSNLQATMYPRGIILSTGEDTPEGHSVRGRMMILELTPGDITAEALTKAQGNRSLYPATTAAFIRWLAPKYPFEIVKLTANVIRDKHLDIGHTRTPAMIGRMVATIDQFLQFCLAEHAIDKNEQKKLFAEAQEAIIESGRNQTQYLETADPCEAFSEAFRHMLAACLGHLRTPSGGIPRNPTTLGWTEENSVDDSMPMYKSHGKCIGWIDWKAGELYIDATGAYADIKKTAGSSITLGKQTMFKRLKDAGMLTRTDDARQRNTVRLTAENHPRQVLALSIASVLQTQEIPTKE